MINYNSPIIIYVLLLDRKRSSSGTQLSARLFSKYTPRVVAISDDIVRFKRLYEKCTVGRETKV